MEPFLQSCFQAIWPLLILMNGVHPFQLQSFACAFIGLNEILVCLLPVKVPV